MDLAAILGFHSMMNQDQYHENESGKWAQKAEQIGILIIKNEKINQIIFHTYIKI